MGNYAIQARKGGDVQWMDDHCWRQGEGFGFSNMESLNEHVTEVKPLHVGQSVLLQNQAGNIAGGGQGQ